MKNALWILLLLSTQAMSATIAVIDSGVDTEHKDFTNSLWINAKEIADNGRDEDGNGYQDDIYGWNFAENNNLVIDRKYLGTFSADPYMYFQIQGRMFLGTATEADKKWVAAKRKDQAFSKEMGKFGNFVHGTHVAGITLAKNIEGRVLAVKLIPTEISPFIAGLKTTKSAVVDNDLRMTLLKAALGTLAGKQMELLEEIAAYVGNHKADIANGSFGTGYNQAKNITDMAFKTVFRRDATEEESRELALHFMNSLLMAGNTMVAAAPNTLFVFAAGNDGMNNDKFPTSPTNIIADNVISVAATYKYEFIAPFSNYGTKMVDVAAPGMLIESQIPGNEYLQVSGTSQAAPYVANIAAQIKDINPKLTPADIKKILMGTVDEKSFLTKKVKARGIVNMQRATVAATSSLTNSIDIAIDMAKNTINDVDTISTKSMVHPFAIRPLPLAPMFK